MDLEESRAVVQIDEHNLDKECVRLPTDYLKYSHVAVDAKRDLEDMKNRLEVIQADLSKEIRSHPENFGLEKVTETAVASTVLVQARYQKFVARLQTLKHEADLAQAVVWALEHKKRTLTLLVELYGMGYFSSPKISKQGREAVMEKTMQRLRHRDDD